MLKRHRSAIPVPPKRSSKTEQVNEQQKETEEIPP